MSFRLALVQLLVSSTKEVNLRNAKEKVIEAARKGGAQLVVLPECFNSPYGTSYFADYAEDISESEGSPTCRALSDMAKEAGVYLIGGSIPERVTDSLSNVKYYNTCTIWNPLGEKIGTHRKV
jgi:omega-amidase